MIKSYQTIRPISKNSKRRTQRYKWVMHKTDFQKSYSSKNSVQQILFHELQGMNKEFTF